ncbi:hypothetical protein TNCV_474561 [Trichonephila clavipes]|nr:hypothetical protein TNCV_474561 [Trichonephila clavipes]
MKFGFGLKQVIYLFYLSNIDHLKLSLPISTDDVIIQVFIESSVLEQMVAIHPGMAAMREGLVSSQTKPVEEYSQKSVGVLLLKAEIAAQESLRKPTVTEATPTASNWVVTSQTAQTSPLKLVAFTPH